MKNKRLTTIYKTFLGIFLIIGFYLTNSIFFQDRQIAKAATDTVSLSATITEYLAFSISAGDTVAFGNITPQSASCSSTETTATVTTNALNGYTLGLSDSVASTDSAFLHGVDGTTRIPDYAGTIASPTTWSGNGLGATNYFADSNKNTTQWGEGTTVCDSANKYAGVPQNATTAFTKTGYTSGSHVSKWGWKLNVANTQKTGNYTGTVTFTATAVLS